MADEADIAARELEREEERRQMRIEARRVADSLRPQRDECEACGEILEPHRIAYGICFDCKSEQEIRDRRVAR